MNGKKFSISLGGVMAITGCISGVVGLIVRCCEASAKREQELKMKELELYRTMPAEDRKEIMIEKEKTRQAESNARAQEAQLERIKRTQDLINDPFTDDSRGNHSL